MSWLFSHRAPDVRQAFARDFRRVRRNIRDLPQNLSDAAHIAVPAFAGNYPGALSQALQITARRRLGREFEWPVQSLTQSLQRGDLSWSRLHPSRGTIGRQFVRAAGNYAYRRFRNRRRR